VHYEQSLKCEGLLTRGALLGWVEQRRFSGDIRSRSHARPIPLHARISARDPEGKTGPRKKQQPFAVAQSHGQPELPSFFFVESTAKCYKFAVHLRRQRTNIQTRLIDRGR